MRPRNDDLIQLRREILDHPPSAALPSNLPDHWLEAALQDVERVIGADAETGPEFLHLPLNLVLHLLNPSDQSPEIPYEQRFRCIEQYRIELAMEKLRRWGVQLVPPQVRQQFSRQKNFLYRRHACSLDITTEKTETNSGPVNGTLGITGPRCSPRVVQRQLAVAI